MFTFEYMACCQVGAGFQVSRGWRKGQTEAWLAAVKEKKKKKGCKLLFSAFFLSSPPPPLLPTPALPRKKAVLSLKAIKNDAEF